MSGVMTNSLPGELPHRHGYRPLTALHHRHRRCARSGNHHPYGVDLDAVLLESANAGCLVPSIRIQKRRKTSKSPWPWDEPERWTRVNRGNIRLVMPGHADEDRSLWRGSLHGF
jgi:hypothetical protein